MFWKFDVFHLKSNILFIRNLIVVVVVVVVVVVAKSMSVSSCCFFAHYCCVLSLSELRAKEIRVLEGALLVALTYDLIL